MAVKLIDVGTGLGSETNGIPSHIKISKILLFATVDCKTAATYENMVDSAEGAYDITKITSEITLIESIHSLSVIGSITVIDNYNIFQDARIHGQEKIHIRFERYNIEKGKYDSYFDREFYVTNLSEYARSEYRTLFTLEFASPHIYVDKVKRISRAYGYSDLSPAAVHPNDISGSANAINAWRENYAEIQISYNDPNNLIGETEDLSRIYPDAPWEMIRPEQFIYHLLRKDLEIPPERIFLYGYHPADSNMRDHSYRRMKLIIPGWRPLQAIKWLIRNTYSETGQPWYVYETITSGIRIEPYEMLITEFGDTENEDATKAKLLSTGRVTKVMTGTYKYNQQFTADPASKTYYQDMHEKIWELTTNFSFDMLNKAAGGAFSSQEWYVDIATKFTIPNNIVPISDTTLRYCYVIDDEKDKISKAYAPPFAMKIEERIKPSHAPNFQETNYTYYVPYNTALHGMTEETFPYNSPFDYDDNNPSTVIVDTGPPAPPPQPGTGSPPAPPPGGVLQENMGKCNTDMPKNVAAEIVKQTEEKFGLPRNLLSCLWMAESSRSVDVCMTGTATKWGKAIGPFQILPGNKPPQTFREQAEWAAKYLRNGYNRWGQSWFNACQQYHGGTGGPNSKNWGPKTKAYATKIMNCSGVSSNTGALSAIEQNPTPKTADAGVSSTTGGGLFSYSLAQDPKDLGKIGRKGEMIRKNASFISHVMKVFGDFRLNPGMIIDIEVQRSIDPQVLKLIPDVRDDKEQLIDMYVSGIYFVSACKHIFNNDGFFTYATINRDSSSLPLNCGSEAWRGECE